MPADAVAPVLLGAVASACLWLAWRGRGHGWLLASLGCGLAALLLWVRAVGPEFGVIYALGVTALGAWALIAHAATPARRDTAIPTPRRASLPTLATVLRGLGTAVLVGPAAFALALVLCLHAVYWLPAGAAARWVTAVFTLPLLWAAVATVLLCLTTRRRAAVGLCLATGLGIALLPTGSLP